MTPRESLLVVAKGFCMGSADVVPGVSGGTMAFILGIYQRLLEAIRSFDLRLLGLLGRGRVRAAVDHTDLVFLAFLGLGIAMAVFFFTRLVPLPTLIHTHPEPVYGLFFGLVVASVAVLLAELEDLGPRDLVPLALGTALGLGVANMVPAQTPETAWFVFLSGALAICAMILPGISGSFILLMLRKYAYVFDALGRLDMAVIIPFALGAVTGLMVFSRLLVWLLHHFHRVMVLAICGILVGSLWVLWPFQERVYETVRGKARLVSSSPILPTDLDRGLLWAVALGLTGFLAVMAIHRLSRRHVAP
ncbi:MAG: DUF368 domain-containing protein [Gammaproteobacteria bacterium]|nr:DUF368 domain-containing protein [Gammaproteobacteria bacterium]